MGRLDLHEGRAGSDDRASVSVLAGTADSGDVGRSASGASERLMTPPVCIQCLDKPVKRKYGVCPTDKRPLRIEQGVGWRWYCSPSCAAQERRMTPEAAAKISRKNIENTERRIQARLEAACRSVMDAEGKVRARDMVRVMLDELRHSYQRQYHRTYTRKAKAAVA